MMEFVKNHKWYGISIVMSAIMGAMAWHADHSMVNIKPMIDMPE